METIIINGVPTLVETAEEVLEDQEKFIKEFEIRERLEEIDDELLMSEDVVAEFLGGREDSAEYARLLQSIAALKQEQVALRKRLAELSS